MKRNENSPLTENSVTPCLSEPGVELVLPSNSDDTTLLNGEKPMTKFDFHSLATAEKQQSIDDYVTYQEVLREIARDECTRSQAEILRLLERCERDASDLKTDVKWRIERDEKIAELRRAEEYRTRNDELLAELKAMREEFEKVEAEYYAKRYTVLRESNTLGDKLARIKNYRHELVESCRDTNLKLELQVLEDSFDDRVEANLFARQKQIDSEISHLKYKLDNLRITLDRQDQKRHFKQEIKQLQDEWQQLEIKKGEVARQKAEHQQAIDAMREKMILS